MPTPFENWLTALRADIDDAVAYLTEHPKGLTGFQAAALASGLFPRIERRLEQVRGYATADAALEGPLGVLQGLRDGLWELLAPWCDPEDRAASDKRLMEGDPSAPRPAGVLAAPTVDHHRDDLRLYAERALVRNHFGLMARPAPVPHRRSHTRRHATPPGAMPYREPDGDVVDDQVTR